MKAEYTCYGIAIGLILSTFLPSCSTHVESVKVEQQQQAPSAIFIVGELIAVDRHDDGCVLTFISLDSDDKHSVFVFDRPENYSIGDTYTVGTYAGSVEHIWLGEPSGDLSDLDLIYDN